MQETEYGSNADTTTATDASQTNSKLPALHSSQIEDTPQSVTTKLDTEETLVAEPVMRTNLNIELPDCAKITEEEI
jgi:hypothetical protein